MGYEYSLYGNVFIPAANVAPMLQVLLTDDKIGQYLGVGQDKVTQNPTMRHFLSYFDSCWDFTENSAGDIDSLWFEFSKGGSANDRFLELIAPFVRAGSYLHGEGEDNSKWRIWFNGQRSYEQSLIPCYSELDLVEQLRQSWPPTATLDEIQSALLLVHKVNG